MSVDIKVEGLEGFEDVPVIEVLVSEGDAVTEGQSLIVLESDKATMELPAPQAGTITSLTVNEGDTVSEGDTLGKLEPSDGSGSGGASESGEDADATDADTQGGTSTEDGSEDPDDPEASGTSGSDGAEDASGGGASPTGSAGGASADSSGSGAGSPGARSGEEPSGPLEGAADPPAETDVTCDVLVLGSGPGGYTAAFRAADLGKSVVLVERFETLGGVCLNVGCIPSKALLHAGEVLATAKESAEIGLSFGEPEIDLETLGGWQERVVGTLTGGLAQMAKARKVQVLTGEGVLTSPTSLAVTDAEGSATTVAFASGILAVGSRAAMLPDLPEDERIVTSTGALETSRIGGSLLVVGGGIIGLEMATVHAALGAQVTVVEALPDLMSGADRDLVKPLRQRLEGELEAIHVGVTVDAVKAQKNGIKVSFALPEGSTTEEAPRTRIFDRVLVAVGRRPNGDRLDAQAAGLVVDERGTIPVDASQRTNVPTLYAIGDVVGQPMLAHKATHEAKVAAEHAAGHDVVFDARAIPSVAYTDPEVAWAGLTETQAKADGTAYEVAAMPWSASGRALGIARTEGRSKLLVDPETRRILGGGIVGRNAGELVSEVCLAIEMGANAEDVGLTVHPHPTLAESLGIAAEVATGSATDLPPKRRRANG